MIEEEVMHSTSCSNNRHGLTLVELLVIVSIIGIIIALALPAIQGAREANRRIGCTNKMKQIGIAVSSHHAVFDHFPSGLMPSGAYKQKFKYANKSPMSIHVQLLPFIDNSQLYNDINIIKNQTNVDILEIESFATRNATASQSRLDVFVCPSDNIHLRPGCNYRASVGPHPYLSEGGRNHGGGGAFPGFKFVKSSDIRDGLSNTVAFSERVSGSGRGRFLKNRDIWLSGIIHFELPSSNDIMAQVCSVHSRNPLLSSWPNAGKEWCYSGFEDTLYNHVSVPNWNYSDCDVGSTFSADGTMTGGSFSARSNHPGGVNVLSLDGSVRFISNSINLNTWRSYATRAGGDNISINN